MATLAFNASCSVVILVSQTQQRRRKLLIYAKMVLQYVSHDDCAPYVEVARRDILGVGLGQESPARPCVNLLFQEQRKYAVDLALTNGRCNHENIP